MNRILSLMLVALLAIPAMSAKRRSNAPEGNPAIEFAVTTHDFGTVREEDGWLHTEFEFTNTGTAPLVITTCSASCGCTKPEFPTKPIAPGKTGKIKVRYTPVGVKGEFEKKVTVRTNVKGSAGKKVLTIKGVVIPKE